MSEAENAQPSPDADVLTLALMVLRGELTECRFLEIVKSRSLGTHSQG